MTQTRNKPHEKPEIRAEVGTEQLTSADFHRPQAEDLFSKDEEFRVYNITLFVILFLF